MIKPFYESRLGKLFHGDCLEVMQELDIKADMILCDLPYGTTACKWDVVIPFEPLWEQYKRLIKPNGAIVLTASQPFTSALVMSNPKMFKHSWIWNKGRGANFPQVKKHPLKIHEDILVFCKTNVIYIPQIKKGTRRKKGGYYSDREVAIINGCPESFNDEYYPKSILDFSTANNFDAGHHPTQKPVALMQYLIKTYTNDGELVLDNCAGSGTTAVACELLGRRWILIEQDLDYCQIAANRIKKASEQFGLFEGKR